MNKYSAQLILDIVAVPEDESEIESSVESAIDGESQPCTSASCNSQPIAIAKSPIKSCFIQWPSKRGPNGPLNPKKKFKFCQVVKTLSEDEEAIVHNVDKVLLCPLDNVMLRSDHIMQAIEIIKLQFQNVGGLVDTLILTSDPARQIELDLKETNVFILFTPNLAHWVVLTDINHHDEGKWLFLDSLNHTSYIKS